jgi:hypothetical protein
MKEFWHFGAWSWNSDKISSLVWRKIVLWIEKMRNFEWIIIQIHQNGKFNAFFLKFWNLNGAKVCTSCRSRKMLQNEYLVAIAAVQIAENEPLKVWGDLFSLFSSLLSCYWVWAWGWFLAFSASIATMKYSLERKWRRSCHAHSLTERWLRLRCWSGISTRISFKTSVSQKKYLSLRIWKVLGFLTKRQKTYHKTSSKGNSHFIRIHSTDSFLYTAQSVRHTFSLDFCPKPSGKFWKINDFLPKIVQAIEREIVQDFKLCAQEVEA